ncbi:hypothetical protein BWI96_15015 [Siphonobacter sp. SORGH_AS_0500]|nr:hypothetical protein BWI96_15015 [Siphonobacter sp. SORGH_AS_0500]
MSRQKQPPTEALLFSNGKRLRSEGSVEAQKVGEIDQLNVKKKITALTNGIRRNGNTRIMMRFR